MEDWLPVLVTMSESLVLSVNGTGVICEAEIDGTASAVETDGRSAKDEGGWLDGIDMKGNPPESRSALFTCVRAGWLVAACET